MKSIIFWAVPLFLSIFSIYLTATVNNRNNIKLKKYELYLDYLNIITDATKTAEEQRAVNLVPRLITSKQSLILYASPKVLDLLLKMGPTPSVITPEEQTTYSQLLIEMRKDLNKFNFLSHKRYSLTHAKLKFFL